MKVILIPLDNRPVTYTLPVQIGELNRDFHVIEPPREIIGGLTRYTNVNELLSWLETAIKNNEIDYIACCLDTIAYGGLIPSRRSPDDESAILNRLNNFRKIIENSKAGLNTKIYAFSSIMRISNNNINEEEKEYWDKYGELIFKFSCLSHKFEESGVGEETLKKVVNLVPEDILNDYMSTRKRNFNINKHYLDWVKDGFLDFLVYSQDDTAQWGLNVQEAQKLSQMINYWNLSDKVVVRTGADEIPIDILIRGLIDQTNEKISIYPVFSTSKGKDIVSRYEDRTILESVLGQMSLCGVKLANSMEEADLILLTHTPVNAQNDHAMKIYDEPENIEAVKFCINLIKTINKPLILADIAYANGADNLLINELLASGINLDVIYGYAGWNTTGNTLGSAISTGVARYIAQKTGNLDIENFKKLLLIRLTDDWAYQTIVRQEIRVLSSEADMKLLEEELKPFIINISKKIGLSLSEIDLSFPWNRTFEVEINI